MDPTENRWKPNDVIRLGALVGGFVLFLLGALMLYQGISAEGLVDLKSTLLSGSIKTASAGLYICFFAVFIIAVVLATIIVPLNRQPSGPTTHPQRIMKVFWGLLLGLALCLIGAHLTNNLGFNWAAGVLGTLLLFVVLTILRD
jgi:hypothetical protein